MDEDDIAEARAGVGVMLMNISEVCGPLYDAAEGVRADMLKRGYNEFQAGEIATRWLVCSLPLVVRP